MHARYCLGSLPDHALVAGLAHLVRQDRQVTADLLAHLAELDARQLVCGLGFSSLFTYCVEALGFSEPEAYFRITAARLAARFPEILEHVAAGRLHLSGVNLLSPHLTADNVKEVLARAAGKSKRQIEELVAAIAPKPDAPARIRKLPAHATPGASRPGSPPAEAGPWAGPSGEALGLAGPLAPERDPARSEVKATAPDRYAVSFAASRALCDKLRDAQALLRAEIPGGDLGAVFERALDALLLGLRKKKFADTKRPRRPTTADTGGVPGEGSHPEGAPLPAERSRHIPAEVKRQVAERDDYRCAFVGETGRRCTERAFLEFHHVVPFARGGETTVANLRLACFRHNQHQADLDYGRDHMAAKRRASRRRPTPAPASLTHAPTPSTPAPPSPTHAPTPAPSTPAPPSPTPAPAPSTPMSSPSPGSDSSLGSEVWHDVELGLCTLGFRSAGARRAIAAARATLGSAATLEEALREALRHATVGRLPRSSASAIGT